MENKSIDLNSLVQSMEEKFQGEELSEIEKARYLYIELGKLLRYDINMLAISYKVSDESYYKDVDFDNIDSNKHSCRQMAMIYSKLLDMVGIKNRTMSAYAATPDDETPHKYVRVFLEDGRNFIADMTWDPEKIQAGLKTNGFGKTNGEDCLGEVVANVNILDDDEIKKIDEKIGYIRSTDKFDYMDSFLAEIRKEMDDPEKMRQYVEVSSNGTQEYDPSMIIGYKLDLIRKHFPLSQMGFTEGNNYLRDIYNAFFTPEEKQQMMYIKMKNEYTPEGKALDNIEYFGCYVWQKNGEPQYYIYQEGHDLELWEREQVKQKVKSKRFDPPFRRKNYPGEDVFYEK